MRFVALPILTNTVVNNAPYAILYLLNYYLRILCDTQGVQVDSMDADVAAEAKSSPGLESEEFCALLRQQKSLNSLTEHALRKNQPLIVSNLMHEKGPFLQAEDLVGTLKLEQMCLQALSMRLFPGSSLIEISLDNMEDINQELCPPRVKDIATPSSTAISLPDADLRTLVSCQYSVDLTHFSRSFWNFTFPLHFSLLFTQ